MRKIKLGFVGCGFMGQLAHLPNFIDSEKCEVIALAELRQELAHRVAEKYHIPKVYRTHKELSEDEEVEAVVAILPETANAPVVIELLQAGKHVMIEKPMTNSAEWGEKMVQAADRHKVKLMVGYMKRYDPGVERTKALVQELAETEELGDLTFVRAHCFGGEWVCNLGKPIQTNEPYPHLEETPFPQWLPQNIRDKYRSFINVYCHNVNLLRYLLGEPSEVSFADFSTASGLMVLNFGKFIASLETGYLSADFWDEETKIYYRDGWLELLTPPPLLRNVSARLEVYKAGKKQENLVPHNPWEWSFRRQAEHFLDCILKDEEPRSSGKDSLKDLVIQEEAFRKYLSVRA